MSFLAATPTETETRYAWYALGQLNACARDNVSADEERLRREEVEAIAMHAKCPNIRRACMNALRPMPIAVSSNVIPLP
jgi:hypothetical protein